MEILIKEKFIKVISSVGKYITDGYNIFEGIVYFPLDYDTTGLSEINEEEKNILEIQNKENLINKTLWQD